MSSPPASFRRSGAPPPMPSALNTSTLPLPHQPQQQYDTRLTAAHGLQTGDDGGSHRRRLDSTNGSSNVDTNKHHAADHSTRIPPVHGFPLHGQESNGGGVYERGGLGIQSNGPTSYPTHFGYPTSSTLNSSHSLSNITQLNQLKGDSHHGHGNRNGVHSTRLDSGPFSLYNHPLPPKEIPASLLPSGYTRAQPSPVSSMGGGGGGGPPPCHSALPSGYERRYPGQGYGHSRHGQHDFYPYASYPTTSNKSHSTAAGATGTGTGTGATRIEKEMEKENEVIKTLMEFYRKGKAMVVHHHHHFYLGDNVTKVKLEGRRGNLEVEVEKEVEVEVSEKEEEEVKVEERGGGGRNGGGGVKKGRKVRK